MYLGVPDYYSDISSNARRDEEEIYLSSFIHFIIVISLIWCREATRKKTNRTSKHHVRRMCVNVDMD